MTETLLYAAILAPCLIIAIVFHEVAHGLTALALGDPTAREQRRLSLNPVAETAQSAVDGNGSADAGAQCVEGGVTPRALHDRLDLGLVVVMVAKG